MDEQVPPQNDTLREGGDVLRKMATKAAATGSLALPRKKRGSHIVQDFLTGNLRVYKGEVMRLNHCHTVLQHLNKHIRP